MATSARKKHNTNLHEQFSDRTNVRAEFAGHIDQLHASIHKTVHISTQILRSSICHTDKHSI